MEQTLKNSIDEKISLLELYVVMNSSGSFFRAKGYGGYGDTWVNDISKAKTYGKIGPARSRVTWFSNTYPQYPPPAIIKLKVSSFEIMQENERVQKAKKTKEEKEAKRKTAQAKRELEYAREKFERAQKELDSARTRLNQTRH